MTLNFKLDLGVLDVLAVLNLMMSYTIFYHLVTLDELVNQVEESRAVVFTHMAIVSINLTQTSLLSECSVMACFLITSSSNPVGSCRYQELKVKMT